MSRDAHKPTDKTRDLVKLHAACGTPQTLLAELLSINEATLRKHYRRELDLGLAEANAKMGGSLYNRGINGDTTAAIFWMKTRAGWRERVEIDPTKMTNDQIEFLLGIADPKRGT